MSHSQASKITSKNCSPIIGGLTNIVEAVRFIKSLLSPPESIYSEAPKEYISVCELILPENNVSGDKYGIVPPGS